jgi:D-alanyl-D-alanine carboxypeptidase
VTRIRAPRTRTLAPAKAAAGLLLAAIVVACGTTAPTSAPSGSLAATSVTSSTAPAPATATASPSAAAPLASIVPVPTSQLVAPVSQRAHLDEATAAALQKALGGIRGTGAYPGVSAAVVFPDGSLWAGQSGSAVLSPQAPLTPDTLFSVGSISKTFVAALTGRLAARGTISLDDPLAKYVPTFHDAASITLRQLLNHTSGVQDIFEIKGFSDAILANRTRAWTTEEVLAKVGSARYAFAPGKGYRYSNTDYVLLGAAIEQATGQPIAALIRSEFLEPLGLTHTFLQTEEEAPGAKAHGYWAPASAPVDQSAGTMLPFTAEATAAGPAGAYVSTATDLARWGDALYNGNVLDQATLAAMADISQTQGFKAPYTPVHWLYGLGMEETSLAGQTAWGHRGHLDGFWSAMWYLPASHVTIVVIANAEWADPVAACSTLAKVIIA